MWPRYEPENAVALRADVGMQNDVGALQARLEASVGGVQEDVGALHDLTAKLQVRQANLEGNVGNMQVFTSSKVHALTSNINTVTKQQNTMQRQVQDLKESLREVQEKASVEQNLQESRYLKSAVLSQETKLSELQLALDKVRGECADTRRSNTEVKGAAELMSEQKTLISQLQSELARSRGTSGTDAHWQNPEEEPQRPTSRSITAKSGGLRNSAAKVPR
jgi:predicted  nucleic acid-binding Zn-ribbon protein